MQNFIVKQLNFTSIQMVAKGKRCYSIWLQLGLGLQDTSHASLIDDGV